MSTKPRAIDGRCHRTVRLTLWTAPVDGIGRRAKGGAPEATSRPAASSSILMETNWQRSHVRRSGFGSLLP